MDSAGSSSGGYRPQSCPGIPVSTTSGGLDEDALVGMQVEAAHCLQFMCTLPVV